jgi:hypothetical protein
MPSDRPDLVSTTFSDDHLIVEGKVFNGKNKKDIGSGVKQINQYCSGQNKSVGYLVVYNVSKSLLGINGDGVIWDSPYFRDSHRTLYVIVINLNLDQASSKAKINQMVLNRSDCWIQNEID